MTPVETPAPIDGTVPGRPGSAGKGAGRSPGPAAGRPSSDAGPSREVLARFLSPSKAPARIGNLVYLVGIVDVLSVTLRPLRGRLHNVAQALPGGLTAAATATTIVVGILLVLLGHSVKRRKRRAWLATVVLLAVGLASHVLHGPSAFVRHPVPAVLTVLGLVLLVLYRREFTAQGDPTTRWRALWMGLLLLAVSTVLGLALLVVDSRAMEGGWPGLGTALAYVLQGFVGVSGDITWRAPHETTGDAVDAVLLGLGLMTALTTGWLYFRSPNQPATMSSEDDAQVRALLAAHPDSLGYFATREDKSLVWSESRKACIGYRVVGGTMLAGGDPIGDPEAWPGAITAYLKMADDHGWTPAVLGCSERGGRTWNRLTGFQVLEIGDEAVVDTSAFSLDGRPMRNVRQMVNRIRRQGYETSMTRVRDLPAEVREQALHDADRWRTGGTERGFSMATSRVMDAERDGDDVVILATRDGVVDGMLQFVPWGPDGMSLDLMRRNPAADPGINELLIVDALAGAPDLGISRVSLNFAMFRSTFERGERLGAGPVLRAWRRVLIIGNRWFQLESLYRFNAKFQPTWVPRFVVYPTVRDLARVSLAMGQAEAFIVFPTLSWPLRGGR